MKEPTLEQRLFVMKMIWGAFLLTLLVFGGVLQVTQLMTPEGDQSLVPLIYGVVVLTCASLATFLPKTLYANNKKTMSGQSYLDQIYVPWILRMVLFEQAALVGFVFCFQTGQPNAYLPFFAVAFLGQLTAFPSENRLRSIFT